ncbi:MAG: U32 family peptidase [Planctomycetaceae bacterium]|nr:U32 family peptidase [Planctomycetaceae bacterium]
MLPTLSKAPELMAPAGDWDCARAAVANGADAIYFGLRDGLNARGRATNFSADELPELMAFLHTYGVKGYLTLNTLVFGDELDEAERLVRLAVAAGIDAALVQDLGLLRLIARLCPELPLHASTQMTLGSAACIAEVAALGLRRVVLPRELSIAQIAAIRRETSVELEAFVHGALCVSYSGQCLASLAFGGRSANRGQCAQPCRLPYDVVCDGRPLDLGQMRYPMSTHDLAAYDRAPELIAAGVSALKIEGRLKPPEYVAAVTRHYRAVIDAASDVASERPASVAEMEMTFSRGFCHGWLDGPKPRALVSGTSSAKRGTLLGEVTAVCGGRVTVHLAAPVRRGDGVVFDGDRLEGTEVGGRLYEIFKVGRPVKEATAGELVEIAFRRGMIESGDVQIGRAVWKTDDPRATQRLRKSYAEGLARRVPVDLTVEGVVGGPLRVKAMTATGASCDVESSEPLAEAVKHPMTVELLTEQFGRLGNTAFQLRRLNATLDGRAMAPLSVLGKLRHEMVSRLEAAAGTPPSRNVLEGSAVAAIRAGASVPEAAAAQNVAASPQLHALCRSVAHVEAALGCGVRSVIADLQEIERCADAVRTVHAAGGMILLATPRIEKPGEAGVLQMLADQRPDGLLVRNLAALGFCRREGLAAVADFSLNAVNELTVRWLHEQGAQRVTAAYDLDERQLIELAEAVPPEWLEVIAFRHIPMFHAEYCLFCRTLSKGSDRSDCGRPCRRHALKLRDRLGVEHPVLADSQCRNTVFHAEGQACPGGASALLARGVRHFRIELLPAATVEEVRQAIKTQQHALGLNVRGG